MAMNRLTSGALARCGRSVGGWLEETESESTGPWARKAQAGFCRSVAGWGGYVMRGAAGKLVPRSVRGAACMYMCACACVRCWAPGGRATASARLVERGGGTTREAVPCTWYGVGAPASPCASPCSRPRHRPEGSLFLLPRPPLGCLPGCQFRCIHAYMSRLPPPAQGATASCGPCLLDRAGAQHGADANGPLGSGCGRAAAPAHRASCIVHRASCWTGASLFASKAPRHGRFNGRWVLVKVRTCFAGT